MQEPFLRFLALFRARVLEAGGAPLNTALRQGCPGLAPPPCLGLQRSCSELVDFSHPHPCSALHRDQTQWPGSFPGMTTCVLLPLLRDRHCQQPLLCHGDAKDCGLWHRQAGELRGQAKGCRQAPTGELGLEGGFFTWAGLIPAACSSGWTSCVWGVQAGLQPQPQPEHHIHILVTDFGHLFFSWQCQSSRTAGKRGKWTSLAMSLLLQLSRRSLLVVLSHV